MSKRIFYRVPEDSEQRLCPRCEKLRRFDEFVLDKSKRSGRGSICKPCDREKSREYYSENRAAVLARAAAKRGPAPERVCSECGERLEGGRPVVCSPRCRDARYRRAASGRLRSEGTAQGGAATGGAAG